MQREITSPRPNWRSRTAELGLLFAEADGQTYWDESARYRFTRQEVETIESATLELHHMCLNAVQHVIDHKLYARLAIPENYVTFIETSWNRRDPYIYGRFDLAYDGKSPPKMLEYNADTPTALLEASVIQWDWLQAQKAGKALPAQADQFNYIHESLVDAWKKARRELTARGPMHFACDQDSLEDVQTTQYLQDTAAEAGLAGRQMGMKDIGHNGVNFTDLKDNPVKTLFKLYPWEWMAQSDYADQARIGATRFVEPVWKMILSNKGILPILWEMYPDHPNLLPAYDTPDKITGPYVKKPLLSREGANIEIVDHGRRLSTDGIYGEEGHIYQAFRSLPNFAGNFPVVGSWVTSADPRYPDLPRHPRGGEACGIGIREDRSPITRNVSRFVPHYFCD